MRVLDVSMWRPMPHATQILCDLGADVLKVERPGGDPMRSYPELFASLARGKRSIELDLKQPVGIARAVELVGQCDVFCESWRPGVADRLGLGATTLMSARPELIYCSISGYGQDGPWRDVPGHDLNYQALGGAVAPRPGDEFPPPIPRLPVADLEAGTLAALLVCAAWAKRIATGEGERIDVAMADVVAWWVGPRSNVVHDAIASNDEPSSQQGSPGYGVFVAADGGLVTLAPLSEPHLWRAICEGLQLDELADTSFAERLGRIDEIRTAITDAIGALPAATAIERLRAAGAPVAPVLTPEAASVHRQFAARGIVAEVNGVAVPLLPARLDQHPRLGAAPVPSVGEHDGFRPRSN
jgi:CoA:oxalate CoA-transferase